MHNQMVDNNTYNVLMAMANSLKAHQNYEKYAKDGNQQLWNDIEQHCEQIINLLQRALPQAMQQGNMSQQGQSTMQGQANMSGRPATPVPAQNEDYSHSGDMSAINDTAEMGSNGPNVPQQKTAQDAPRTNEDSSLAYPGETQMDYAAEVTNEPEQRMGYRQPEGTV
jgi:hypothetical protein